MEAIFDKSHEKRRKIVIKFHYIFFFDKMKIVLIIFQDTYVSNPYTLKCKKYIFTITLCSLESYYTRINVLKWKLSRNVVVIFNSL